MTGVQAADAVAAVLGIQADGRLTAVMGLIVSQAAAEARMEEARVSWEAEARARSEHARKAALARHARACPSMPEQVEHARAEKPLPLASPSGSVASSGSDPISSRDPDPERAIPVPLAPAPIIALKVSTFDRVMTAFSAAWGDRYRAEYRPTPKDKSQFGRLLKGIAPTEADDLPRLFGAYIADDDPFIADKLKHPLWWFCTDGWNRYRGNAKPSVLMSEKERRGVAASLSWLAKKERQANGEQSVFGVPEPVGGSVPR